MTHSNFSKLLFCGAGFAFFVSAVVAWSPVLAGLAAVCFLLVWYAGTMKN